MLPNLNCIMIIMVLSLYSTYTNCFLNTFWKQIVFCCFVKLTVNIYYPTAEIKGSQNSGLLFANECIKLINSPGPGALQRLTEEMRLIQTKHFLLSSFWFPQYLTDTSVNKVICNCKLFVWCVMSFPLQQTLPLLK